MTSSKLTMKKPGILLTTNGLADLRRELDLLKGKKLPEVLDRVAKAREDGDLSENSAYQTGTQEQEFLQGRIEELEEIIKNASLIQKSSVINCKAVDVGCTVTVSLGGKKQTFSVVGDWEAKPAEKKISGSSPLGKALMGKSIGDKAEVEAPAGKIVYTIVGIE